MRMLQYRQELFGYGYTVSSNSRHYECKGSGEHPPIKVTRLSNDKPLDFAEDLIDCIDYNVDCPTLDAADERLQRFVNILSGKNLYPWIVGSFQITADDIYLDVYNDISGKMDWFNLKRTEYDIVLRFDVPHSENKERPSTKYEVYLPSNDDKSSHIQVTEQINGIKREIQFFRKSPESEDQYIEITEYADL